MLSDFYDIDTEPVIQLSAVYGEPKNILEKCIILFSKEIHDYLLCNYECKEIGFISACNGNITIFSFNMAGEDIAFYLSAIGSAAASQICYEVHWQTGAKKFVMFGSCGSLDHEKTDGKYAEGNKRIGVKKAAGRMYRCRNGNCRSSGCMQFLRVGAVLFS